MFITKIEMWDMCVLPVHDHFRLVQLKFVLCFFFFGKCMWCNVYLVFVFKCRAKNKGHHNGNTGYLSGGITGVFPFVFNNNWVLFLLKNVLNIWHWKRLAGTTWAVISGRGGKTWFSSSPSCCGQVLQHQHLLLSVHAPTLLTKKDKYTHLHNYSFKCYKFRAPWFIISQCKQI